MVELTLSRRKPEEALVYAERLVAAAAKESLEDVMRSHLTKGVLLAGARKSQPPHGPSHKLELQDPQAAERAQRGLDRDRRLALQTIISVQRELGLHKGRPCLCPTPARNLRESVWSTNYSLELFVIQRSKFCCMPSMAIPRKVRHAFLRKRWRNFFNQSPFAWQR